MSDADRRELYPSLPEWWPRVEVPFGLPVLLPQVVDHFGSVMMARGPTDMVWAMFATHWLLEVVSTWLGCVSIRGMLWRLSPTLIQGIKTLGVERLTQGCSAGARSMLDAALALHDLIDWKGVENFLRRPPRWLDDPGDQRWFV